MDACSPASPSALLPLVFSSPPLLGCRHAQAPWARSPVGHRAPPQSMHSPGLLCRAGNVWNRRGVQSKSNRASREGESDDRRWARWRRGGRCGSSSVPSAPEKQRQASCHCGAPATAVIGVGCGPSCVSQGPFRLDTQPASTALNAAPAPPSLSAACCPCPSQPVRAHQSPSCYRSKGSKRVPHSRKWTRINDGVEQRPSPHRSLDGARNSYLGR